MDRRQVRRHLRVGFCPSKYQSALADNSGFTVGEEIKFGDKANGGFSKVSMGMAITKSCQHPVEAAALIDFLWNGEGAAIITPSAASPPPPPVWLPLRLLTL